MVGSPFSADQGAGYFYARPDQDTIFRSGFE